MIPKPSDKEGLVIGWPQQKTDMEVLQQLMRDIQAKM
jgi:hypothetical protein